MNGRTHCQTLKTQWFLSNEICTDTHLQASCGKDRSKKFYWDLDGKTYRIGKCLCVHRKQGLFLSVYVDDTEMAGRKQIMALKWEEIDETGREPTSLLDHVCLGCTQRECKPNATTEKCSKHEFLLEQLKIARVAQEQSRGHTIWKDMRKSALKDVVIWQTKRRSACAKSQLLAWMTITSKKGIIISWENCQKYAPRLS